MSVPMITLPNDQYAHPDANTEWWWHIGTLMAGERIFGFEIALNGSQHTGIVFTQLMLTDVQHQKHYQSTSGVAYWTGWASPWESTDPEQPFFVIANGPNGAGCMTGFGTNPLKMSMQASFTDIDHPTQIIFQLQLNQAGPPLLVWGTGEFEANYYYSLTNIQASGHITIGDEQFPVTGITWMDHEWGVFPPGTAWVLQSTQLDNGFSLMNYITTEPPKLGVPMASRASILARDGTSTVVDGIAIPLGPIWTDRNGIDYFTKWLVEIPAHQALLEVTALVPGQAFEQTIKIYEGVAWATGTFDGSPVSGTAWLEQKIAD